MSAFVTDRDLMHSMAHENLTSCSRENSSEVVKAMSCIRSERHAVGAAGSESLLHVFLTGNCLLL